PPVRCLATSRLVMGLANVGESRAVPPLPVPVSAEEALEESDAARLFAVRVRQRLPDHRLADRASLARILRATGGFPLGIELAGARVVDHTLAEIAAGLEESPLEGQRTAPADVRPGPARHESMEACLDWSLRLLPADQQAAFP